MNAVKSRYIWLTAVIRYSSAKFLNGLDAESILGFQKMNYVIITFAGSYLLIFAHEVSGPIQDSLGVIAYTLWLGLNIVCPVMSLVGRKLYAVGGNKSEGESNPAFVGAHLQLWGDFGVWMAITIYIMCAFNDFISGSALYAFFYVLMGFPGGFMLTARSVRRLLQIRRRERKMR